MSLKSMLNGKSDEDREFQEIIFRNMPSMCEFKTVSGKKVFKEYDCIVPYNLSNSLEASIVGIAFDYLARAMIAQKIENQKETSVLNLKSLCGLKRLENVLNDRDFKELQQNFSKNLCDFIGYIYSDLSPLPKNIFKKCAQEEWSAWQCYMNSYDLVKTKKINELIFGAYYFAKLEQVYRSGRIIPKGDLIKEPNEKIVKDLANMCTLFQDNFIGQNLVQKDSVVVFNPSFDIASCACGVADADVYIDGVLYDFKTTKDMRYKKQDVAQLTMYYYLNIIANLATDLKISAELKDCNIKKIAFYKARYGEIEYCETSFLKTEDTKKVVKELSTHLFKRRLLMLQESF